MQRTARKRCLRAAAEFPAIPYRESDLDYCRRLLAEEGLSFRFSHDQNAVAGDEATHARHRLEIFDRETALPDLAQPVLRFHRNNATEASDTVQTWQEIRNALPNAVTIAGWDYKTLLATGAEVESTLDNGEVPRMEVHDASLPYRYTDGAAARRHADLRLAAWEAAYRRFAGDSTVRQAAAGQNFTLSQHEEYQGDDARYTLLAVDHDGANNLGEYGGGWPVPSYSWGHKGSSTVATQTPIENHDIPKSGEIDLMEYHSNNPSNHIDFWARSVAHEQDVKGLIWLTRIQFNE